MYGPSAGTSVARCSHFTELVDDGQGAVRLYTLMVPGSVTVELDDGVQLSLMDAALRAEAYSRQQMQAVRFMRSSLASTLPTTVRTKASSLPNSQSELQLYPASTRTPNKDVPK